MLSIFQKNKKQHLTPTTDPQSYTTGTIQKLINNQKHPTHIIKMSDDVTSSRIFIEQTKIPKYIKDTKEPNNNSKLIALYRTKANQQFTTLPLYTPEKQFIQQNVLNYCDICDNYNHVLTSNKRNPKYDRVCLLSTTQPEIKLSNGDTIQLFDGIKFNRTQYTLLVYSEQKGNITLYTHTTTT